MCYAFTLRRSAYGLAGFFGIKHDDGTLRNVGGSNPRVFIAPKQSMLTLSIRPGWEKGLTALTWGAEFPAGFLFNARSDKLMTSAYWKSAFDRQRCLIPADGWYDLHQVLNPDTRLSAQDAKERGLTRNGKEQYFFHLPDDEPFAIAAIYGLKTKSAIMVTTEAAPEITHLHDRMPALIRKEHWEAYLDPTVPARDVIECVQPYMDEVNYFKSPKPIGEGNLAWPEEYSVTR